MSILFIVYGFILTIRFTESFNQLPSIVQTTHRSKAYKSKINFSRKDICNFKSTHINNDKIKIRQGTKLLCQLLGMNCARPTDCTFSFTGFTRRGGDTDKHSDGWGLAFYEGRGIRTFLDPLPAAHSPIAKFMTDYPIKTHNMLAHIRYATHGTVLLENVHPFQREMVCNIFISAILKSFRYFKTWLTFRLIALICCLKIIFTLESGVFNGKPILF